MSNIDQVIKGERSEGSSFIRSSLSETVKNSLIRNPDGSYGSASPVKTSAADPEKKIYRLASGSEVTGKAGGKAGYGSRAKKNLINAAADAVIDQTRSDDIGVKALHAPRDVNVKTKAAVRTAKRISAASKTAEKATEKATAWAGKGIGKLLAKLLAAKGTLMALGIILSAMLVVAVVLSVTSMFVSVSLKNKDAEITETYRYITQLDAEKTKELRNLAKTFNNISFSINGYEADIEDFEFQTDADRILMYLDLKYGEYQFEQTFGENMLHDPDMIVPEIYVFEAKTEVKKMHAALYRHEVKARIEKKIVVFDYYDKNGDVTTAIIPEDVYWMDINVEMKDITTYIAENELLDRSQLEQMEIMGQVGLYLTKNNLQNPFENDFYVTKRWGYTLDVKGKQVMNNEIEIPATSGTDVKNVMSGTVESIKDGTVTIMNEDGSTVTYRKLRGIKASEGETVTAGEVLGRVSGSSLFIQYYLSSIGTYTNPVFFISGAYITATGTGSMAMVQTAAAELGNYGRKYIYWAVGGGPHAWCVMFVRWCADQQGLVQSGKFPGVRDMNGPPNVVSSVSDYYRKKGLWQQGGRYGGSYIPKPGDLIIFEWDGQKNDEDHIGIVEKYENGRVYTIEGNSGGSNMTSTVKRKSYLLKSSSIIGYCTPQYE